MKAGDVLNGYTILEDFKVVGAGLSKWTFAERGGRQYFIKEFLSPTYPDDDAPGSEKIKAKKRARCAAFESSSPRRAARAGSAVRVRRQPDRHAGLFPLGCQVLQGHREGRRRAGLTRRHRGARLTAAARLDEDRRAQPEDSSRSQHRPRRPQAEQRLDQAHRARLHQKVDRLRQRLHRRQAAAPRRDRRHDQLLLTRVARLHPETGVPANELGVASDIFALGLIYTEYLTGAPPPFDVARYHEPAVAVRNRESLRIPRGRDSHPTRRPHRCHAGAGTGPTAPDRPRARHPDGMRPVTQDEVAPSSSTALRGKGLRTAVQRRRTPESRPVGRLVGKLVRKRTNPPTP